MVLEIRKVPFGLVKKFGLRSVGGNVGFYGMSPLPVRSFIGSLPTPCVGSNHGIVQP
uniref:Uncharacterized protein n=1 Tax=Nelumbo nucifera TaxID=4432 RepID=A0A822ZHX1_NELNU|nr:TPA_asm: hypothetical protein HUJ06_001481 [Nelumbo nucifera]